MKLRDALKAPLGQLAAAAVRRAGGLAGRAAGAARRRVSRRGFLKASAGVAVAATAAGIVMRIPRRHKFGKTFVLYTADACRADVIGKVINGMEVTPNLNRLAERGLYFSNAYSTSNHTRAAVAGILTGEPTPVHGVKSRAYTIPVMTTLATYLAGRGYGTLATLNNRWLEAEKALDGHEQVGYARGFQAYSFYPPGRVSLRVGKVNVRQKAYASDEEVRRRVFKSLGARLVDREFPLPALVWVYSMRTHWPRLPERPNEFTGRFREKGLLGKLGREKIFESDWAFEKFDPSRGALTDAEVQQMRAIYYEAAAYMDEEFGRFMEELGRHDSGEVTVIFTGDHGESLGGEDKEFGHGLGLGESVLRVPLVIAGGDFPVGTVDRRVSNSWLLQTLMMLSGDYIRDTTGQPLDPRRLAENPPIYASTRTAGAYITSGGKKVIRDDKGDYAFYDIVKDPSEAAPLALDEGRREELKAELVGFEARCEEVRERRGIEPEYTRIGWQLAMSGLKPEEIEKIEGVQRESGTVEKSKIEEMKALGYLN